jgi:hypothetical protein
VDDLFLKPKSVFSISVADKTWFSFKNHP